jgi:TolB-like protein
VKKLFLLSFLLTFSTFSRAADSTISRKLQGMAEALAQGYAAKRSGTGKESLAVLSFSSSESLAKTKAGFAVSELLTHFFVQRPDFTVVERNLLNKLEEEQKFQAMSADTATAVKIGKIIGAKLLVLGSVEKMSRAYQTSARLVRTETGEILATAFEELPVKDFEEEAKPYLNLVPERQAIGFYIAYQFGPHAKAGDNTTISNWVTWQTDYRPVDMDLAYFGGGIRYYPTRHAFIDVSYLMPAANPKAFDMNGHSVGFPGRWDSYAIRKGYLVRGFAGWSSNSFHSFRWEAAAGAVRYSLRHDSLIDMSKTLPCVRLGLKYFPQERFAMGVSFNQNIGTYEGKFKNGVTAFRLEGFSIEPSLSLYF